MKKILATILVMAAASATLSAWGGVTTAVQSVNSFGAIKVTGAAKNLYVPVPFEGFDDKPVAASNVIHAAGLTDDTSMYVWNSETAVYDLYVIGSDKWTAPSVTVVTGDDEFVDVQSDLAKGIAAGTGVLLERTSTSEPVYVYGQIPMSSVPSPTFDRGQTLVCIPSTNAMQAVNLNAFAWTGVKAARSNRSVTSGADYIQFRDENNRLIKYYYLDDGSGWGLQPRLAATYPSLVADGKALVPAGTAFWYYSTAGGAKLEWNPSGE